MPAYLLLLLAVVSRLVPHAPWFNFTAVGGSLLYFGARRSWKEMAIPVVALMATDVALTTAVYHYSFQWQNYVATWAWYGLAMVLGKLLLGRKTTFTRVAAAVVAGPTSFFLISNFAYWLTEQYYPQQLYPHTAAGLLACYTAALPFYGNDIAATTIVAGLAFGLPVLLHRIFPAQPVRAFVRSK